MNLVVVTPPAAEPVLIADAKLQLRVTHDSEDSLITHLIVAAREHCEMYHGRAYITQTLKLQLDEWPEDGEIVLPRPPYQSVTSIKYIDSDGAQQTIDAAEYQTDLNATPGRIIPAYGYTWPTARGQLSAIEVTFTAGYGDAGTDVPARICQAVLLRLSDLYENREAIGTGTIYYSIKSLAAEALLSPDRITVDL